MIHFNYPVNILTMAMKKHFLNSNPVLSLIPKKKRKSALFTAAGTSMT